MTLRRKSFGRCLSGGERGYVAVPARAQVGRPTCQVWGWLCCVGQLSAKTAPALQLERQQRSYRWQQQMEQTLTVEQLQAMAVSWQELLRDARLHRGILDVPVQECKLLTPAQRT